jgi:ubiquinone/menaquinone biosynthesis C-methylase UbiE
MPDRRPTTRDRALQDYYGQVAQAFDQASLNYDVLYQENPVMAWMRRESLAALRTTFPPASHLLEIGCGTGDEALALSREGYRIVATDVSPGMVEAARAKAAAADAQEVTWHVLGTGRLDRLLAEYGPASFDGAYASFGAFNCEPDLGQVSKALSRLLQPGSKLVCSVMNRWCLWEICWELLHLRPRRAFRRTRQGWRDAGLASPDGSLQVPVLYYTPHELAHLVAPHFQVESYCSLPVLLPPPYLAHILERFPAWFHQLEGLERHLRGQFPFRTLGDHFLMVATHTGPEPPRTPEQA